MYRANNRQNDDRIFGHWWMSRTSRYNINTPILLHCKM